MFGVSSTLKKGYVQFLFINSAGGLLVYGIALHDISRYVEPDVHTLGMGVAASTAAFILSGGAQTKRLAFPHVWRQ